MHVLIDCRFAKVSTGLGRYTRELVPRLIAATPDIDYSILVPSEGEPLIVDPRVTRIVTDIPHYSFEEQWKLPALIAQSKANLFFSPHFNVPWRCPIAVVATIHDLILHQFPNGASALKQAAYRILLHHTVRRATRLITVSDFVQTDLATAYGSNVLEYTTRIYEGVSDAYVPQNLAAQERVRADYQLPEKFFLYVGNSKEHKNVQLLIDAFTHAQTPDTHLVLVTSGPEVASLRLRPNVHVLSSIQEKDLPALYSAAIAFCTASLYEGFCLPVLEARHCGCPVIASDTSAIPEVAGDDSILIPPTLEAFTEAFGVHPERPTLVQRWTWEQTAQKTGVLLREVGESLTRRS